MNKKNVHAFKDDALGKYDGVALAELIKKREIQPLELVKASIERADIVNPNLNAIVTKNYEKALEKANNTQNGFFEGIPTFFKDLTYIEGFPTYFGTEALENAPLAQKTDAIVKQILDQGFIHLGNSTLPEFGFTCSTEMPHQKDTTNPWNIEHSCGGSSGGAAALVAAGVVPIAHSADGGGSTRIPASCCGLVGLKATRGRILPSDLFKQQIVEVAIDGVITRTVRDTAYFYAEAEKYYKNPKLKPIGLVERASDKKYKIGFTNNSIKGMKGGAKTEKVLRDTAKLLEDMGHHVKEVDVTVSDQFFDDFIGLWQLLSFATKHFGKFILGKHFDKSKMTTFVNGLAAGFPKNIFKTPFFIYRLKKSYYEYQNMLKEMDVDIILTPTMAHITPKIGYLGADVPFEDFFDRMTKWATFTPYANACGAPAISLPLGHDEENNLPIGMMFWANHGEESILLDLSYQLEAAKPWKKIYE